MNDTLGNHSHQQQSGQSGVDHDDRSRHAAGDDRNDVPGIDLVIDGDDNQTGESGQPADTALATTDTTDHGTGFGAGQTLDRGGDRVLRLTPARLRAAVMAVAALLSMALIVAVVSNPVSDPVSGTAPASSDSASDGASGSASDAGSGTSRDGGTSGDATRDGEDGHDRAPTTGRVGRAVQRLDQPVAVPGYRWRGWTRYPAGRCAWMPAALLKRLPLAEAPVPHATSCSLSLREGDQVHITWGRPTSPVVWDPSGQHRTRTIAGLGSRTGRFPLWFQLTLRAYTSACRVTVNTRSLTSLSVLVWNDGRHRARCETAREVTALIVHSMIPAAGGTPWPDTPQRPAPMAVTDRSACELLEGNVSGFGGLEDGPPRVRTDELGEICTYAAGDTSVSVLLTTGPHHGLAGVRPLRRGAAARLLGTLPAREERLSDTGCALTVEITIGQVLRVTYRSRTRPQDPCGAADVIAGRTVQAMLDRTEH